MVDVEQVAPAYVAVHDGAAGDEAQHIELDAEPWLVANRAFPYHEYEGNLPYQGRGGCYPDDASLDRGNHACNDYQGRG